MAPTDTARAQRGRRAQPEALRELQPATLRWVVAACTLALGALMLVLPQRFSFTAYDGLRPLLSSWGLLLLLAGMALAASAVVAGRTLALVGHGLAGLGLLGLAAQLVDVGAWLSVGVYLALGFGIGLAAFLPGGRGEQERGPDLLGLTVGAGNLLTGLLLFAGLERIGGAYARLQPGLPLYLSALLGSGALLVVAQLTRLPRRPFVAAHLLAALVLGGVALGAAVPLHAWAATLVYGGSALGVASLPWTHRLADRLGVGSLRTRLALALALVTAVPLIVGTAVTGESRERAATSYALSLYQTQAETLAAYVSEYARSQQAAVAGVAALDGFLDLPPAEQERRLRAINAAYPEITGFSTFDAADHPLARSDGRPLTAARDPLVSNTRARGSAVSVSVSDLNQRPVFAFGSAFHDRDGRYYGLAAGVVENARIADFLARHGEGAGWRAYLADDADRAIAHPDPGVVAAFADLAAQPPLIALRQTSEASGSIRYSGPAGAWLAGYAPVPDLGWAVVVERPEAAALADAHAEREIMFRVLGLILVFATILGWLVAGRLVAPLQSLGRALAVVAEGGPVGSLPRSNVRELQQVALGFDAMRARLAARTVERDQVEQQLRELNAVLEARVAERTADLNTALLARDEFISIASHELRNPLAALRGISQLMRRALARDQLDSARLDRNLLSLDQASARLVELTDDLLDVSRLQSGRLPPRRRPTDLAQLVREVAARQPSQADGPGPELEIEGGPCVADLDPERLEQVVANLLENAVKYSPDGGRVGVLVRFEEGGLLVRVRDQGIGIPPAALERVFEPFGRASNASQRHIQGMGLGLYICRRIVEQHGGRIWAESAGEGQGTMMSVWLPASSRVDPAKAGRPGGLLDAP